MMQKKGIFFTLAALILVSLLFITYTFYTEINKTKSVRQRVETMNTFLVSLEEDMSRQMYIAGFRTVFLIEDKITQTGLYATSPDTAFQETFFNGTLYGEPQPVMLGATYNDIVTTIKERAQKINVNVTIGYPNITLTQDDPWHVKVVLRTSLDMRDANNLASWNKTHVAVAYVSIENFEDPIYLIGTNRLVTNSINKTRYQPFAEGSDVSNLTTHALNSYYVASPLSPSFLDRLQGITAPNAQGLGIESLVNLQTLSAKGINVQDKTAVDYLYFSTQNPTSHHIQGMPGWFRIDTSHLELYNVTNLTI